MTDNNEQPPRRSNPGPDFFDGDPDWTELRDETLERVLSHIGFSSRPEPTIATLNEIAKQWSRHFGYDNIAKRIYLEEKQTGAFPLMDPNDYFEFALAHGTGGGCWPSGEAAFGLLRRLGFDVERIAGTMLAVGDILFPAHGALNVYFGDRVFRMEPSLGADAALELIDGTATRHDTKAYGLWQNGDRQVWWQPGHTLNPVETTMTLSKLSSAFFYYRNEATKQFSIFNASAYIRRTRNDGSLTYAQGKLIEIDKYGEMTAAPVDPASLKSVLVEQFGLSEEIVDRLPVDRDGVAFADHQ
ncbi:MAG: arylamine N-acetyltransferase [Pseudomonadota bacterium]